MAGKNWVSVHVAYFGKDQDALIAHTIGPLLSQPGTYGYFVKHWRRGPHLRVNVGIESGEEEDTRIHLRAALAEGIRRYPSTASLDPVRILRMAEKRATLEGDTAPLVPLYRDNSIYDAPYEDPRVGFSGSRATEFLERFYVATNANAFSIADSVLRGESRLGLLYDIFAASAHNLGMPGPLHSWGSMRSHADKFRYLDEEARRVSAPWDKMYTDQREGLIKRMVAVQDQVANSTRPMAHVDEWVGTMRPVYREALDLVLADEIVFERTGGDDAASLERLRSQMPSPIHQEMLRTRHMLEITEEPAFRAFRVLLALTYAHAHRLGVNLAERYLLCHLVASAMEDLTQLDPRELLRNHAFWGGGGDDE